MILIIVLIMGTIASMPIPFIPCIVWYEVNYGKTILPETLCVMQVMAYIMWRIAWWKFLSGTKRPIMGKEHM